MGDLGSVLYLAPRFEAPVVAARDQSILVGHKLDPVNLVKRVRVPDERIERKPLKKPPIRPRSFKLSLVQRLLVGGLIKVPELEPYLGRVDRVVSSLHRSHPGVGGVESHQLDFRVHIGAVKILGRYVILVDNVQLAQTNQQRAERSRPADRDEWLNFGPSYIEEQLVLRVSVEL